jgi:hypothetical protein
MDEDVQLSNVRGFSPLQSLPKTLKKAYPNLAPFTFGFFVADDLPDRYADGWAHLTVEDFPDEDRGALNIAIANKGGWTEETTEKKKISADLLGDLKERVRRRFNILADANGWIKYKNNYVMIQPLDYNDRRMAKMHRISEEHYYKTVIEPPQNPDLGKQVKISYDEKKVEGKRSPGRPKTKEN